VSSPFAALGFFTVWVGVGVCIGLALARRGHDRRTMVALGAGLGPLMLVVAHEAVQRRKCLTQPLVLARGLDHGGDLDVVLLVRDRPEDVVSAATNLAAVRSDVGIVTLASMVDYESLEAGVEDGAVRGAADKLVAARALVPAVEPALVVCSGDTERVPERLVRPGHRMLVLHAVGERSTSDEPD
jgi:hypothetical protein